jgi:hypothetical protein
VPSAAATVVGDQLSRLDAGEVYALVIPAQRQDDLARALDHHAEVVRELRALGWELATGIRRVPDAGEVAWIAPVAQPTEPRA